MQRVHATLLLRTKGGTRHHRPFPPSPSPWCMLTSQRWLSAKLFVGGLSFRTAEEGLRSAFAAHGQVSDVKIIVDRETGNSRGFGFVTFETEQDAEAAVSKMNGSQLDGRVLRVNMAAAAAARPPLPSRPAGFDSPEPAPPPPGPEEWGSIPSNVAQIPPYRPPSPPSNCAGAPLGSTTAPFDVAPLNSNPFDSSTFGGAATPLFSYPQAAPLSAAASAPASSSQVSNPFDGSAFGRAATPVMSSDNAQASSEVSSAPINNSNPLDSGPLPSNSQAAGAPLNDSNQHSSNSSAFGSCVSTHEFPNPQAAAVPLKDFNLSITTESLTARVTSPPSGSATTIDQSLRPSSSQPAVSLNQPLDSDILSDASARVDILSDASVRVESKSLESSSSGGAAANNSTSTLSFINSSSSSTGNLTAPGSSKSVEATNTAGATYSTMAAPFPISPAVNNSDSSTANKEDQAVPGLHSQPPVSSIPSNLYLKLPSTASNSESPLEANSEFDFGLSYFPCTPPPTQPGVRPQGRCDMDIPEGSLSDSRAQALKSRLPFAMFPQRTLAALDLPWETPEADNWSDIGEDPPRFDISSIYSPLRTFVRKDRELFWDPYDFDEDAKLPPEPDSDEEEENLSAH